MKFVDVAEFYSDRGGGVRTYINQKLAAGAAAGHDIVIVAPGPRAGEEERFGGRVIWVESPPLPPDPRYYVLWRRDEVHRILDREQPDVVEGSSPWTGGWFAATWRGDAVKTFIFHQDPVAVYPQTLLGGWLGADRVDRLFGWYWGYLRRLSSYFDATIVSGHWLARKLDGFSVARPLAVPFGIEKELFTPERRDPALRRRLLEACRVADDPDARLLLNVSRFHPEKRLGTLLAAFERLREERPVGLVIIGDGPLRGLVRWRARRIPGVHLAGFIEDREEFADTLAAADAMVHGSAAETYGLVVAEGICSGLPLVVPTVGGAADLAAPEYAETYPPGDPMTCARAIDRLLRRDPNELRAACAQAAATRVGTMGDHFRLLFERYVELVHEKRGGA